MDSNYIAAMIAFLGGSVIALINSLMMAKKAGSEAQLLSGNVFIRQILSFAYLAGTWFVVRKMNINIYWPLIGAACGLTIPSILFAITIAKHMKGDD